MPTNGHDHEELAVLPPNALEMITGGNNNNQELGLLESLFCDIFFNATWGYARIFPKSLRRAIEFILLLMVNFCFILKVEVYNL